MVSNRKAKITEMLRLTEKGITPTGTCWCGCGAATRGWTFFAQGHDRTALFAAIEKHYGSVVEFIVAMNEKELLEAETKALAKRGFYPTGRVMDQDKIRDIMGW